MEQSLRKPKTRDGSQTQRRTVLVESKNWAQCYKTFFMLNLAEHEILNAHMYEIIKNSRIFQAKNSLEFYFSCS